MPKDGPQKPYKGKAILKFAKAEPGSKPEELTPAQDWQRFFAKMGVRPDQLNFHDLGVDESGQSLMGVTGDPKFVNALSEMGITVFSPDGGAPPFRQHVGTLPTKAQEKLNELEASLARQKPEEPGPKLWTGEERKRRSKPRDGTPDLP